MDLKRIITINESASFKEYGYIIHIDTLQNNI